MTKLQTHPRVGIGVFVIHENKILFGERINAHGAGTWGLPGGHLEFGESPEECAVRELEEEAGLVAKEVIAGPWTNDFFEIEGKHYVTLYMIVPRFEGTPVVNEPGKCLQWKWFECEKLPSPLFLCLSNLFKETSIFELISKTMALKISGI